MALDDLHPKRKLWHLSKVLHIKEVYSKKEIFFITTDRKRFTNEMYWNLGIETTQFVYVPGVGQVCPVWVRQSIRCRACDFGDHKGSFPRCR